MGNGIAEKQIVSSVPDSILVRIFELLDFASLVWSAGVSLQWYRVARDELIWKRLMHIDFSLLPNTRLRAIGFDQDEISWYSEYKRLRHTSPVIHSQTLDSHGDEVLHVSFSPDGSLLASCSKDCTVKVWSCPALTPLSLLCQRNMSDHLRWRYSQFSQFNETSQLLLVSGVQKPQNSTAGEIAVYEIDRNNCSLRFRCRVLNRPYDVFGCWFDGGHILSGEHFYLGPQIMFGTSASHLWLCKASQDTHTERTAVLAPLCKFLNRNGANLRMVLCSSHVSDHVRSAVLLQLAQKNAKPDTELMDVELLTKGAKQCSNCCRNHSERTTPCTCICHGEGHDRLVIFSTGSDTYTPHEIGFKLVSRAEVLQRLEADLMPDCRREAVMKKIKEQATQQKDDQVEAAAPPGPPPIPHIEIDLEEDEPMGWEDLVQLFDQPDHIIDMHGHIIGMALTQDQRYLLVNVRPWPAGAQISDMWQPPPISNEIEIRVIDLETLTVKNNEIYKGHRGETENDQCFFIFLDGSDRFVASGSEDQHGYLWSRDYGSLLGRMAHTNVVNSVALNPQDPQMMVTASDDRTIKVWRSRRCVKIMTQAESEDTVAESESTKL